MGTFANSEDPDEMQHCAVDEMQHYAVEEMQHYAAFH